MAVTKTLGLLQFEDLEPHRFEGLVRELVYDFKDWQSIEAAGRSGSDEGFDIRAYERAGAPEREPEEGSPEEGETMQNPSGGAALAEIGSPRHAAVAITPAEASWAISFQNAPNASPACSRSSSRSLLIRARAKRRCIKVNDILKPPFPTAVA